MRFTRETFEAAGGDWQAASKCNDEMDTLQNQRVSVLRLSGDLIRSKIAWKFAVLRQSLTYRLVDLSDATVAQWQEGNSLACIVLARSFLETVAVIHSVAGSARKALEERDLAALDRQAMRYSFGGRHPYWQFDDIGNPINVLTALNHLSQEIAPVRDFYERISEIAHPNSQGTHQFYSDVDKETVEVTFSREKRDRGAILPHLMAALTGLPWSLVKLAEIDAMISQIADLHDPVK